MIDTLIAAARRRRAELLFIFFVDIIYFFSYFQRVAIPGTVFDEIQRDLSLSSVAVTSLGAIYLYLYGGLQIFCGMSIDRFGVLKAIVLAGALLSVGSILFPLSHSLYALYATRALVGIGSSLVFLCIIKEVDTRFNGPNFSMFLSMSLVIGCAGGLFGTFPFERIVSLYGWRQGLLGVGVCSVLALACVIYFGLRAPALPNACASESVGALWAVLSNPASHPVVIASATLFGGYFLVQSTIGKKLLEDCFGLSSGVAALYTFAMMLAAMTSAGLSGFISRLIGNRRKPLQLITTALAVIASVAMVFNLWRAFNPGLALACYIALGTAAGVSPMFTCSMRELNRSDSAATSVGAMNSVAYLTVGVLITAAGLVQHQFEGQAVVTHTALRYPPAAYQLIFIGICGVSLCSLIASLLIRETCGRNAWSGE
ncbi:MAG: MFS transporter [Armatimonadetes bacterium]|nr:MFS transporter [Armatimonadota bacterium]